MNNWPTKEIDLKTAEKVIKKHIDFNDGEPLGIFELVDSENQKFDFKVSDWLIELSEIFNAQYGENDGSIVTQNIITLCLIANETVH